MSIENQLLGASKAWFFDEHNLKRDVMNSKTEEEHINSRVVVTGKALTN